MDKGLLFIISGPSGVGKGSIRELVMKDSSLNLTYSVSLTTREKRPHEVDGKDYYFVSEEEFYKNIEKGNFLEYNLFVGHSYGTPKDKVEEQLDKGKNVLLEIDVNGAKQVMSTFKGKLVTIFILPPSLEELEKRIRSRSTENESDIEKRLARAKNEIALQSEYDYRVVNQDLKIASEQICQIIKDSINK